MKKAYTLEELLISLMILIVIIFLITPILIKRVEQSTPQKIYQEKIKYDYNFIN